MYQIAFEKQTVKDLPKLKVAGLSKKAQSLIEILRETPLQNPPPFEKLIGDLAGFYSRRINIKHRLIYTVHEKEKLVAIRSLWTHYE